MVGDPVLGEVVSANALAAVAGTDQRLALLRALVVFSLPLGFVEPAFKDPQCLGKILVLALFVLALHDDVGFQMRESDGRSRLVDVLTAWPTRAKNIFAVIVGLEVDFHIFRLG